MLNTPFKILLGFLLLLFGLSLFPWPDIPQSVFTTIAQFYNQFWYYNRYVALDTLVLRARDLLIVEIALIAIRMVLSGGEGKPWVPGAHTNDFKHHDFDGNDL